MATRKFTKQLTAEWMEEMRKDLKPGDTLHTVIRGVAPSGWDNDGGYALNQERL